MIIGVPSIQLEVTEARQLIRDAVLEEHHFSGTMVVEGDTLAVTTYLKFLDTQYAVAQYLTQSIQAEVDGNGDPIGIYDTLYVTQGDSDWSLRPLPTETDAELIVVEGVCRLEGFVSGHITVLAADTMFLMDDLVASDVILDEYGNDEVFGRVPAGSPNCIGLIGEGHILVANTLPNGAFNGITNGDNCTAVMGAQWTGGPATPANIQVENSARQDLVLTASVIALGCTFGVEYWHTSATAAPYPATEGTGQGTPDNCGGILNSHIAYWPCYGSYSQIDERGTIWFDGSMVHEERGLRFRQPPGPWDPATIGYRSFKYRYDSNLAHRAPPLWPSVDGISPFELLLPVGIDDDGRITPYELYTLAHGDSAGVFLRAENEMEPPQFFLPDSYHIFLDDQLVLEFEANEMRQQEISLSDGSLATLLPFPQLDCTSFSQPGDVIHLEIQSLSWNLGGSICHWELQELPVEIQMDSIGIAFGPQPAYSTFFAQWNSAVRSCHSIQFAGVQMKVRLVDDCGSILAESTVAPGEFELPRLQMNLYDSEASFRFHFEVVDEWSNTSWSSADSLEWWHNDAPSMAWMQAPPDCGRFDSRSAFLSAWNSAPPVLQLADVNIDSVQVQLRNRGESLREWTVPATHIVTTLELGVLSEEDLGDAGFELSLWIEDRLGFPPEGYEPCTWWYNHDTDVSPRELPQALSLRAFPNPFNPSTTVELALPRSGEVKLTLYNLQGRQLRVIREAAMAAGLYHIPVHGQSLASGLYLLRVEAPDAARGRQQQVHKLLLVR